MRKTLTLMLLALTASPLAACKMFWEHDEKPAAVASTTETTQTETTTADPTKTDPTAMAETGKAAPTTPAQPTPAVPATK